MIENTTEPVEEIGLHQPEKQRLMTEYPSVNRSIRATMNTPFGIDISQIPMRPNVQKFYEGQQYSVLNEPAAKDLIKEFISPSITALILLVSFLVLWSLTRLYGWNI